MAWLRFICGSNVNWSSDRFKARCGQSIASSWTMSDPHVAAIWTVNELWLFAELKWPLCPDSGPNHPAKPFYFFWLPCNSWMNKQADRTVTDRLWYGGSRYKHRTWADNLTSLSTGRENGSCEQAGKLRSLNRYIWQCGESGDRGWMDGEWEPVAKINKAEAETVAEGMLGPEQRTRALIRIVTNEVD